MSGPVMKIRTLVVDNGNVLGEKEGTLFFDDAQFVIWEMEVSINKKRKIRVVQTIEDQTKKFYPGM